jgi:sortase (surface protein transpeptidase)
VAGGFVGSATPGDRGPTIVAGHVDSRAGPGVFFRLRTVTVGAHVGVTRSDGRIVDYQIVDVHTMDKNNFPTEEVYGPTPGPELRLITCGGEFDRRDRRYLDNVVVSAVMTGS